MLVLWRGSGGELEDPVDARRLGPFVVDDVVDVALGVLAWLRDEASHDEGIFTIAS